MKTLAVTPALLGALSWCQPTTPPDGDLAAPPTDAGATALPEAERGDALEATIPLYGEGAVALSQLRGRVVVLEFFSPEEPQWPTTHDAWRSLRAANAQDVEVVAVATASDDTGLVDRWDSVPPEHIVGWDPQGALALRMGIDALPMVLVLDRKGRQVAAGSDRDAMRAAAESLF